MDLPSFYLIVTGSAKAVTDGVDVDVTGGHFGHGDAKILLDLAQPLPGLLVMDEADPDADAAKTAGAMQVRL